ncbi:rhamnogalacturonan acetylesterase [Treponema zioleckii]|uniref:rhamnogalacturonan acetylesterase n=1 Tax=Treponema zioleckii TaxID=331680 RepID=UPI00168B498D|nr:rhamnogalacturonan acetylesterase [Treponema zioleckii]
MRIICLGDSITQHNDFSTYPQTGWVQELVRFFPADTQFLNFARNGRSTKSFIEEGRFADALKSLKDDDFVLIQFGHNDEKIADPTRYTSPKENGEFQQNLEFFVNKLREHAANPILLTPMCRRKFSNGKLEDTHGDYPAAIKRVAEKLNVPCIDMTTLTSEFIEKVGEKDSRRFFMNFDGGLYENYPDGKDDNSHLRPDGAFAFSKIFAQEISKIGEKYIYYKKISQSVLIKPVEKTGNDKEIDDEAVIFKK